MSKPSHTLLFSETVDNPQGRQSCWGGKGGTGWSEEKRGDSTHAKQSQGVGALCCINYGRNHTPVHATWGWGPWYNYIETDNRVTLSTPRETETRTKNQRGWGEKKDGGNGTETREHQFCRQGNELKGVSVWTKDTVYGTQYETSFPSTLCKRRMRWVRNRRAGLRCYFCHLFGKSTPEVLRSSQVSPEPGGLWIPVALTQRDPGNWRARPTWSGQKTRASNLPLNNPETVTIS